MTTRVWPILATAVTIGCSSPNATPANNRPPPGPGSPSTVGVVAAATASATGTTPDAADPRTRAFSTPPSEPETRHGPGTAPTQRPHDAEPAKAARCGRLAGEPVQAAISPWGPHPYCDRVMTTWANVPHADRVCQRDADCVLREGSCFHSVLNRQASTKVEYRQTNCVNPASGDCARISMRAQCVRGCCQLSEGERGH